MSSVIVGIVDGVRGLLQTQSDALGFVRTFTAERVYRSTVKLEATELRVQVAHGAVQTTQEVRGAIRFTVPVTIGVRKTFDASDLDPADGFGAEKEVDDLVELTEQISAYMTKKVLSNGAAANGPANFEIVAPDNIFEENQQFLGKVSVEFIHIQMVS